MDMDSSAFVFEGFAHKHHNGCSLVVQIAYIWTKYREAQNQKQMQPLIIDGMAALKRSESVNPQ